MIAEAHARELVELIESCQWEEAVRFVRGLTAPKGVEASLLFACCQKGKATARIFEAKPRQAEADVEEAVLQEAKGSSAPGDTFQVYRLVLHGEYEIAKVARRK